MAAVVLAVAAITAIAVVVAAIMITLHVSAAVASEAGTSAASAVMAVALCSQFLWLHDRDYHVSHNMASSCSFEKISSYCHHNNGN